MQRLEIDVSPTGEAHIRTEDDRVLISVKALGAREDVTVSHLIAAAGRIQAMEIFNEGQNEQGEKKDQAIKELLAGLPVLLAELLAKEKAGGPVYPTSPAAAKN